MERDEQSVLSIISRVTDNTDQVWKYLICPPKHNYGLESLGPPKQMWGHTTYVKVDGAIVNRRGQRIIFSFYHPEGVDHRSTYTILYLHSHGGCRVEGYHLIKACGPHKASLCIFDFSGAGLSDGDYISMGIYEKDDTITMMDHIRNNYGVQHFVIWGRSMGAATALQAYPMMRGVFAMVLDSPFTTVSSVYRNAAKQHVSLPGLVIDLVFAYASSQIKQRYGFDVSAIRPYQNGPLINVPTVLIGAKEDQITDYSDLIELYNTIPLDENRKVIVECEGKHNDDRDPRTLSNILEFISNVFRGSVTRRQPVPATPVMNIIRPPLQSDFGLRTIPEAPWMKPRQNNRGHSIDNLVAQRPQKPQMMPSLAQQQHLISEALNETDKARRRAHQSRSLVPQRNTSEWIQGNNAKQDSIVVHPPEVQTMQIPNVNTQKRQQLGTYQYSMGRLPDKPHSLQENNLIEFHQRNTEHSISALETRPNSEIVGGISGGLVPGQIYMNSVPNEFPSPQSQRNSSRVFNSLHNQQVSFSTSPAPIHIQMHLQQEKHPGNETGKLLQLNQPTQHPPLTQPMDPKKSLPQFILPPQPSTHINISRPNQSQDSNMPSFRPSYKPLLGQGLPYHPAPKKEQQNMLRMSKSYKSYSQEEMNLRSQGSNADFEAYKRLPYYQQQALPTISEHQMNFTEPQMNLVHPQAGQHNFGGNQFLPRNYAPISVTKSIDMQIPPPTPIQHSAQEEPKRTDPRRFTPQFFNQLASRNK